MAAINRRSKGYPDNSIMGIRIRYVSLLNPRGVNKLAYENGYQPPNDDVEQRVLFLNEFLGNEGEKGLTDFISIHPDKDFIMDNLIDEIKSSDKKDSHFDTWVDTFSEVVKLKKGLPETAQPIQLISNYADEPQKKADPIIIQVPVKEEIKINPAAPKPITTDHLKNAAIVVLVTVIIIVGYKIYTKYV